MMDEIMLFFRETFPLYMLFTPAAVVGISILLVMMMITPSDTKEAERIYKIYMLGVDNPSIRSNFYDTLF